MTARVVLTWSALVLACTLLPALASGQSADINALREEIRKLSAEVADLKREVDVLVAIKPTITTLMPEFSERFHVMHRAGEAGDWAVAGHEMLALQQLMDVAKRIDPERGRLMESFMTGSLAKLSAAIEHGNGKAFQTALEQTLQNCNACHQAAGSAFIRIGLDADRSLSMRHSHAFLHSEVMGKHKH